MNQYRKCLIINREEFLHDANSDRKLYPFRRAEFIRTIDNPLSSRQEAEVIINGNIRYVDVRSLKIVDEYPESNFVALDYKS